MEVNPQSQIITTSTIDGMSTRDAPSLSELHLLDVHIGLVIITFSSIFVTSASTHSHSLSFASFAASMPYFLLAPALHKSFSLKTDVMTSNTTCIYRYKYKCLYERD